MAEATKDFDEMILGALRSISGLSTKQLEEMFVPKRISRATYFRHLKKLRRLMQIEKIQKVDDEGRIKKEYKYIHPAELARREDVEFYLAEIDNSNEDIRNRGLRFFGNLCGNKRVAWFFSPESKQEFKTNRNGNTAFKNRIVEGPENVRLVFLEALENMIKLEPPGSLWRTELTKSVNEEIKKIALTEEKVVLRKQAIKVARRIPDMPLVDIGLHVLEMVADNDFGILLSELKELLIYSEEADAKKVQIRKNLDNLSTKNETLKSRVHKLLETAPP